jgi:hypothetical protein
MNSGSNANHWTRNERNAACVRAVCIGVSGLKAHSGADSQVRPTQSHRSASARAAECPTLHARHVSAIAPARRELLRTRELILLMGFVSLAERMNSGALPHCCREYFFSGQLSISPPHFVLKFPSVRLQGHVVLLVVFAFRVIVFPCSAQKMMRTRSQHQAIFQLQSNEEIAYALHSTQHLLAQHQLQWHDLARNPDCQFASFIHASEEQVPDHEGIIQVRRSVRNCLFPHQPSFVDSVTE